MKLPLRLRLTAVYFAVFFVVIAALELGAYYSVREAMHSIVDHELETRLAGLDDHLTRHIKRLSWPVLRDSIQLHPAFQPDLLWMRTADGHVMFAGALLQNLRIPGLDQAASTAGQMPNVAKSHVETFNWGGRTLRVLYLQRTIQGKEYQLALATDLRLPGAVLNKMWLWMLLSVPIVLVVASSAAYWISGRALAPITRIIATARSMDSTKLGERILVPNTGDEVQLLAETVNGMLARIEDGFQQVRRFTADASHELRTPVAIIRAAAEIPLLRRAAPERVYREALERILRESERSSTLLEDLLLLSRADAGADHIDQESVDLGKSLAQACAQLAPLVERKRLHLHFSGPEQTLWIRGNQEHLRRLWLILLDNAFKYTASGGAVEVSVGSSDGRTYCAVTDSGIGMARGDLSRIFERFYRVDKARTRSHGGTGLGLAIAHEIANLHDAAIEVESELGRGSTFRVSFPSPASPEKIPGAVRTGVAS